MKKKVLMIYPEIPITFWSLKYALEMAGFKSTLPPLGLMTVASLLPDTYDVKLIDMAVGEVKKNDILWADIVFISAMIIQKNSFEKVIQLCNELNVPVAAGGPYPTSSHESISGVDYFILNEAEITLPGFIKDYESGTAKKLYMSDEKPDITQTPVPRLDLIDISSYSSMALQYSRGCPFNCEFCDIIEMFGRIPRTKLPDQFLDEMNAVYKTGFRGFLFIVDDNFIGNKKHVKALLKKIIEWQKERGYPFALFTEASVDLAQDDELLDLMVEAGFGEVFLGIETPDSNTLVDIQKKQNLRLDIFKSVQKIQNHGIEVMAGFIVGFDSDPENIFEQQIDFIQKAAIPQAMVGLLSALPNTQLFRRLAKEKRLKGLSTGDNLTIDVNFITKMPLDTLIDGYKHIISEIYDPKKYFERCMSLLKQMPGEHRLWGIIKKTRTKDFFKDTEFSYIKQLKIFLTIVCKMTFTHYGFYFLRFLKDSIRYNYKYFFYAVSLSARGYHYFKVADMLGKNN